MTVDLNAEQVALCGAALTSVLFLLSLIAGLLLGRR